MTVMRRAARERDPLADLEPLIARVHGYVAYRIGRDPDAEDVTSETFARALRYRDTYDPAKGAPIGWLIGIARRCVDESLRARPAPSTPAPERVAAGDLADDTVQRLMIAAAVGRLGERDRELIALRYGADLSPRQIAARLELTTNAVDVALHRARARLRELLSAPAACEEVVDLEEGTVRISLSSP